MKLTVSCPCGWELEVIAHGQDGMRQSELMEAEGCVKAACEAHAQTCVGQLVRAEDGPMARAALTVRTLEHGRG